jgi:hypothetical protein
MQPLFNIQKVSFRCYCWSYYDAIRCPRSDAISSNITWIYRFFSFHAACACHAQQLGNRLDVSSMATCFECLGSRKRRSNCRRPRQIGMYSRTCRSSQSASTLLFAQNPIFNSNATRSRAAAAAQHRRNNRNGPTRELLQVPSLHRHPAPRRHVH